MWDDDGGVTITAQEAFAQSRKNDSGEELGPKEKAVLELLDTEANLKPAEIAKKLGWRVENTHQVLLRLRGKKKVKSLHGSYSLAPANLSA